MEIFIAPSILAGDFAKMGEEVKRMQDNGADMIHYDVMDGVFVPNITFGPQMLKAIRPYTTLPLDVHLMITEPIRYIKQFAQSGADYITVHYEACKDLKATLEAIKNEGVKVGLSISPDTPASVVAPYVNDCDMILVMSVYPGFGGLKFIEGSLDKIKEISAYVKESGKDIRIEVDGGINTSTASLVKQAGADTLVAGSAVFNAPSPKDMITTLKNA
jgi:ribulose-phosphate 3-epimerase